MARGISLPPSFSGLRPTTKVLISPPLVLFSRIRKQTPPPRPLPPLHFLPHPSPPPQYKVRGLFSSSSSNPGCFLPQTVADKRPKAPSPRSALSPFLSLTLNASPRRLLSLPARPPPPPTIHLSRQLHTVRPCSPTSNGKLTSMVAGLSAKLLPASKNSRNELIAGAVAGTFGQWTAPPPPPGGVSRNVFGKGRTVLRGFLVILCVESQRSLSPLPPP